VVATPPVNVNPKTSPSLTSSIRFQNRPTKHRATLTLSPSEGKGPRSGARFLAYTLTRRKGLAPVRKRPCGRIVLPARIEEHGMRPTDTELEIVGSKVRVHFKWLPECAEKTGVPFE
jgi:hypothetical protein